MTRPKPADAAARSAVNDPAAAAARKNTKRRRNASRQNARPRFAPTTTANEPTIRLRHKGRNFHLTLSNEPSVIFPTVSRNSDPYHLFLLLIITYPVNVFRLFHLFHETYPLA